MPRVMIVEDDRTILENMAELLRLSGLQVLEAHDGQVALNLLNALRDDASKQPCMIISDLMMPNVDGFQLLHTVRADAVYGRLPFALLSAKSDAADIQFAFDLGASDYLVKPFEVEQLMDLVRYHLRGCSEPIEAGASPAQGRLDSTFELE